MTQTVVITGASAGIGRATARLFGQRGANVVLLARGEAGLEGAARDVESGGGKALTIPTDVADHRAVDDAADQAEAHFGPIDLWVNVAFTSVFAPFEEITAEEFKRVTEVSYLGFVYGTMAALARMRPRDSGTIVQVGSALGQRSIPLQSAYCGAKHAINGFTESVRCELLHEGSKVRITVAQMPAVNTPQFSWVLSRLPRHPKPVPPIYQPEVAARGVVYAADHPKRKQYWVGDTTAVTLFAQKFIAPLLDRYLARTGWHTHHADDPWRYRRAIRTALPRSRRSAPTSPAVVSCIGSVPTSARWARPSAFLLCGFWMALADHQRENDLAAVRWFDRNRTACGAQGLFTEDFDVGQCQLRGNLPLAFVHALLLETAHRLADTCGLPVRLGTG